MTDPVGAPSPVRFEHLGTDVLGIGEARPRLSWTVPRVEGRADAVGAEIAWVDDSGAESVEERADALGILEDWAGPPLVSRERRELRVRTLHADGTRSAWSAPSRVEAGLLEHDDWGEAVFVGSGDREPSSAPLLRRLIPVRGDVVRARLYATARGVYEFEVAGRRLDDALLEPGWQSYHHRSRYRSYDLTPFVTGDTLVLGAWLADGWYRGRLGFPLIAQQGVYGDRIGLLARVEIDYSDGSRETLVTDRSWEWRPGPILASDLYDGEDVDLGDAPDWTAAATPDGWRPVEVLGSPETRLVAPTGPPVRAIQTLAPVAVWTSPAGATLVDFGQNLVGRLRMRVRGRAGEVITLRHAEVLENGELGVRPLRSARATDTVVLTGGDETWEPRFTYHGFRYAEVSGWPGELDPRDIDAVVMHTDMPRAGWFRSSNPLLDRLHENVVWGMRGNFVDIPTDCPQRDERLGWTGDLAVFAETAAYLYDCTGMLTSWLEDLAAEQWDDGTVPFFVPTLPLPPEVAHLPGLDPVHTAVWGDAAILVPVALYDATGDARVLATQFESMTRWIEGVTRRAGPSRIWDDGFQFGDWLDPTAPPDDPGAGATEPALVATAYFAHSARLLARVAEVLDRREEVERYRRLADEVVAAFHARFLESGSGLPHNQTQTSLALVLCFDLAPEGARAAIAGRLVDIVREAGHQVRTGFVGTPLLLPALTRAGALDDAYAVLLQEGLPSWLYTVRMGGTTMWERWDSMLPDGSINPGEMTSFNHYAFGAVAQWMHETIGGLQRVEPAYRTFRVAPRPRAGITSAATAHLAPSGRIEVDWEIVGDDLRVRVVVPEGTRALVDLEGMPERELGPGIHEVTAPAPPVSSALASAEDALQG